MNKGKLENFISFGKHIESELLDEKDILCIFATSCFSFQSLQQQRLPTKVSPSSSPPCNPMPARLRPFSPIYAVNREDKRAQFPEIIHQQGFACIEHALRFDTEGYELPNIFKSISSKFEQMAFENEILFTHFVERLVTYLWIPEVSYMRVNGDLPEHIFFSTSYGFHYYSLYKNIVSLYESVKPDDIFEQSSLEEPLEFLFLYPLLFLCAVNFHFEYAMLRIPSIEIYIGQDSFQAKKHALISSITELSPNTRISIFSIMESIVNLLHL